MIRYHQTQEFASQQAAHVVVVLDDILLV